MKRKYLVVLMVAVMAMAGVEAQNPLEFEWKFKTGDDPVWATMAFDDSDWETIEVGVDWEKQGYEEYDGFAWYRQKVVIPSSMKKGADKMGGLILKIGRIDDCDITYLNGDFLGQSGQMPSDYLSGYGVDRSYKIASEKVLWDQENMIAVRVYDGGGGFSLISILPLIIS